MHCLGCMALLPFRILADIHENRRGVGGQAFTGLFDGDFLHARPRFVDYFQESGRMIHANTISREEGWSKSKPGEVPDWAEIRCT